MRRPITVSVACLSGYSEPWNTCQESDHSQDIFASKEEMKTPRILTVGSVFDGRVDGVCIILIFALRKKSAEPPKPFNILEPMTQVELAWAYISLSLCQLRGTAEPLSDTYTSTGVFIPMTPNRRMISGELETCCERKSSFPA